MLMFCTSEGNVEGGRKENREKRYADPEIERRPKPGTGMADSA